jgi:HK97 family phage major capsid protein
MKHLLKNRVLFVVVGMLAAGAAQALGIVTPELALAGGLLPMAIGETAGLDSIKEILQKQGSAFEEFKRTNDELLKAKADGKGVEALEAKLSKINEDLGKIADLKSAVQELEKKMNRPGAAGETDPLKAEHKQAFARFMRKGVEDGLGELQAKAYNITTDGDGGYAVPEELDRDILSKLVDVSPIRQIATVRTVSTSDYKKLVNTRGTASGWVDEDDARTATNSSSFSQVTPFMGELYAYPQATQQMLEDVFFNAEQWIVDEVSTEFSRVEGAAFVSGDGTKKPKGFLSYTTAATADSSRAFGTLQHIVSGAAADWAASNPQDKLLDVVYALKAGFRTNARWVMNKGILGEIRKFKATDGSYLWRPGLEAGQPDTLLGYGITEAEDMPAKAANALSIAFGDFRRGYLIVDRIGTQTLRDPYTNKPYVGFYVRKRVGGCVVDSEAIKLLKFSA